MKYITASIFFCLDICYFNIADITWNTQKEKEDDLEFGWFLQSSQIFLPGTDLAEMLRWSSLVLVWESYSERALFSGSVNSEPTSGSDTWSLRNLGWPSRFFVSLYPQLWSDRVALNDFFRSLQRDSLNLNLNANMCRGCAPVPPFNTLLVVLTIVIR